MPSTKFGRSVYRATFYHKRIVFPPEPYTVVDEDQRAAFLIDRIKCLHQAVRTLNFDSPAFPQFLHKCVL